ncbi:PaaI family thioesterase [Acinetobacter sp. YH16032]|uniref:PaaI family thioesterase n=1 Tax=Acinetobacter sp. YH16032 TaxID=2601181 RepID=UPI0015D390A0|nr:PaaI family thioesterase [Acinetobacter sp. YH16032]
MDEQVLSNLPPIHHLLGGHQLQWDKEKREISVQYTALESFTNPRGSVEGGMICAMLDDAMGILAALNQTEKPAATINLTIDFFRPCEVGEVLAKAWFIKEGRKILSIESEAWQHGKLVAKTSAAFMVL